MLVELHLDEESVRIWRETYNDMFLKRDDPTIFPIKGFYEEKFEHCYKETQHIPMSKQFGIFSRNYGKFEYGVADNIDQIKEYFKNEISDPFSKYVIAIIKVFQHKGASDGWRWSRWGIYIGDLDPQCEYLDDEDFGDDFQGYVICFHIKKVD